MAHNPVASFIGSWMLINKRTIRVAKNLAENKLTESNQRAKTFVIFSTVFSYTR